MKALIDLVADQATAALDIGDGGTRVTIEGARRPSEPRGRPASAVLAEAPPAEPHAARLATAPRHRPASPRTAPGGSV